jgi:hypothetical protein
MGLPRQPAGVAKWKEEGCCILSGQTPKWLNSWIQSLWQSGSHISQFYESIQYTNLFTVYKCLLIWMSASMNVCLYECLLIWMSANTNVSLYKCLLIWMSAYTNVRLYECLLICMSAYTNVRLYECLLIGMSAYMNVRLSQILRWKIFVCKYLKISFVLSFLWSGDSQRGSYCLARWS